MQIRGICKECGEEFFVDSENCGTDESLCEECANWLLDMEEDIQPTTGGNMKNKYRLLANKWKDQADKSHNTSEQAWLYACAADLESLINKQSSKPLEPTRKAERLS